MNKKYIKRTLFSKLITGLSLVSSLVLTTGCSKLAGRYGLNEEPTNLKTEQTSETKNLKDLVNLIINRLPIPANKNILFGKDEKGRNMVHNAALSNDETFIDVLSNGAKNLIKYLIYKQAFKEEKFLFNVNEFNRFMKYINMPDPSDGLAELCGKEVLANTKDVHVCWVNKDLFNTGVFEPKHMACTEEDGPS